MFIIMYEIHSADDPTHPLQFPPPDTVPVIQQDGFIGRKGSDGFYDLRSNPSRRKISQTHKIP